jgi:hypothetical protein
VIDENASSTGMFSLFHDSWNAFPTFAILDHTMTVRAKPWTLDNNTNTSSCDGTSQTIDGWSGGSTSNFLQQLVDECGSLCEQCQDTNDTDGDGIGDECDDCHNLLGDVNDDLTHNILDIVTTVNIILAGGVGSGEFTECEEADADMDSNGVVNILDVIQIINLIVDDRAIHEFGNVEVRTNNKRGDFYLYIDSEVNFSGFQLQINGEYPNLTMIDNNHINLVSRINNGKTHVVAYSIDNTSFNNNLAEIKISSATSIEKNDFSLIVSSPTGEALALVNKGDEFETIPDNFGLTSVYPNPFNPTASISFELPSDEKIKLSVFDVLGNEVDILFSDNLNAGEHTFTWDASEFSSGVYYFKLKCCALHSSVMKALLMK